MSQMQRIRCSIMRGGTSKGVFLFDNDLPEDIGQRDALILKIFGSPDIRQIDGLGGADPLTSKLAVIGAPSRPDADVDYTFHQINITEPIVGRGGNCGNISAAVGPFAIDAGFVKKGQDVTVVRIYNTNSKSIIKAEVPMTDGEVAVNGDYTIAGVPGTGARIKLDYSDTIGAKTGKLLPTGNPSDELDIPGFGKLTVSMVDAGNPVAFVRAADIGLKGTEQPADIDSNPDTLKLLETIRQHAGVAMGLQPDVETLWQKSRGLPMLAFVAPPHDYVNFTNNETIRMDECDFVSRLMFMQVVHKTYAGTASVCTACAAKVPGTVVYAATANAREKKNIRIGHPAGVIEIGVAATYDDDTVNITEISMSRTARRIMDGYVYVRK